MNEEELKQTEERAHRVLAQYLSGMSWIPPYPLDSCNIERLKKDKEEVESHNRRLAVNKAIYDFNAEVGICGHSFSSWQCMTGESLKNRLVALPLAQTQSEQQKKRQIIETAKNGKQLWSKLRDADAKDEYTRTRTVTIKTANRIRSVVPINWDEHYAKVEGVEATYDLFMVYSEEDLAIFDAEIIERKKSPKIKELTKNMVSLVKQAEKLKFAIIQANIKAQKALSSNGRPDIKTCKVYVNAKTEFDDLSYQHSNLMTQLTFYMNDTASIPSFPGLSCDDISAEHAIKEEWRRYA